MGRGKHNKPDKSVLRVETQHPWEEIREYLISESLGIKKSLTATQTARLQNYKRAVALVLDENKTQRETIAILENELNITYQRAAQIVRESQLVFGATLKVDKEFVRASLHEYYTRLLYKAQQSNNLEVETKVLDSIAKLHGLNKTEEEEITVPKLPEIIEITTDITALTPITTNYQEVEEA